MAIGNSTQVRPIVREPQHLHWVTDNRHNKAKRGVEGSTVCRQRWAQRGNRESWGGSEHSCRRQLLECSLTMNERPPGPTT